MTISTTDSFSSGSDLQTYTFSGTDIGVAAENRVVFAAVSARKSGSGASTLLSVTINGVAAEIIRQTGAAEAGGYNIAAIVAAVVPTGTSVDVVVQWSTTHARSAGHVATSYDALPDAFDSDEVTGTGTLSPSVSREDGGTSLALAMVFSSGEALTVTSDATSFGSAAGESNPRVYFYDSTNESFTATTNGSTYTPIVIEASFRPQRLPAIRPHQKTLLHLRDSAQLDFGPERQTLTNSGVTVNDDVFTFTSGDNIKIDSLSGKQLFISFWIRRANSGEMLLLADTAATARFAFVWDGSSTDPGFNSCSASEVWVNAVSLGANPNRQVLHNNTPTSEWTHIAANVTFDASVWENAQIGTFPFNTAFNLEADIADVRFCEYEGAAGEVFDLYNEGRNWVLQRRVDQAISIDPSTYAGSGDLLDRSSNGNNGTLENGTAVVDSVISFPGATSQDIHFTGGTLTTGQDLTIAAWIKPAVDWRSNSVGIWDTGPNAFKAFRLYSSGSGTLQFEMGGNGLSSAEYTIPADWTGQWFHFAVTHAYGDAATGSQVLYVNGVQVATGNPGTRSEHLSANVYFGRYNSNYAFAGEMDKLLVAYDVYTAEQIAQIYALGREEDTGTAAFDLPERKQLPDTRLHLVDGLTDAGFYGGEVTNAGITYENGVYGGFGGADNLTVSADVVSGYGNELSFAAWIRPTSYGPVPGGFGRVCSKGPDELEIMTKGGSGQPADSLEIKVNGVSDDAVGVLTQSEWQHLAVSVTGTTALVYIDGSLVDTLTVGTPTSASSDLGIGNRIDGTAALARGFIGEMADIHYSHNALTAGEVANLYRKGIPALRDAEVLRIDPARYSGDGDLIDQTGNGNNGTLTGSTTVSEDGTVSFLESSGHVETGTTGLSKTAGTYAFWFKSPEASTVNDRMYFFDIATTRIVFLKDSGTGNSMTIQVDGRSNSETFPGWSADEWNHIAATWDTVADEFKIYFNGEQQGSATGSGSVGSNSVTGTLVIGAAFDGSNTVLGEMDKIVVASEAYTADQIAFLASSREFADPFPEPFLGLGGETLNIQPSRYSGNGDLLDESGNGNDLTLPSGYSVADGVISSDGTTNGPVTSIDFNGKSITAAVWVKTTDDRFMFLSGDNSRYVGQITDGNTVEGHAGTNNRTYYVDGAPLASGTATGDALHTALCDGTWHHFAITCDTDSAWGDLLIMQQNEIGFHRYIGEMDDLRIDNTRKYSAEEIKLLASSRGVELPNTRDAKLYFAPSYDDASNGGTSVIDYSGNQNTGTISGGPTWASNTSPDNGHRAIVSTGAGNVSFSDDDLPLGDSPRSVVTWVRPDDYSDNSQWFDYGSVGTGVQFGLGVRNSDWIVVVVGGGALGTQDTPAAGTWVPVVVTYAGGALDTNTEIWIDGVSKTLSTQAGTTNTTLNTTENVGRLLSSIAGQQVEAALDDVLVFDRVLTPAEIAFFSDKRNPYGTAAAETPVTGTAAVTYYRALVNSLATRGVF